MFRLMPYAGKKIKLLLKRKLPYVLSGRLANAAVELASKASSNVTVAESTTIELCIDWTTFEKKTDLCILWSAGQGCGRAGRWGKLERNCGRVNHT